MGNTIVRSLVLVLAVAGFTATSLHGNSASVVAHNDAAKTLNSKLGMVCSPAPLCAPGSTCGLR